MYKGFFGLKDNPFNVNPDPRFLYLTKEIEEALSGLKYGVQNRKGFITLTGEVGTGKTTLVNRLLDWLHEQKVRTAFLFNSRMNTSQLFDFILAEFNITCESTSKSHQLMKLNRWLLDRFRAGETTALIVDEAQNLTYPVLEEIRLLTNLETSTEKLLQIVLSGQPELEDKLKSPQLRQLRQRIMLRCKTTPLTEKQTNDYIIERLRIAGSDGKPIFSAGAIGTIHKYSTGIPRVVNLLCEHSLINAYVEQQRPISAKIVQDVAHEFQLDEVAPDGQGLAHAQTDQRPGLNGEMKVLIPNRGFAHPETDQRLALNGEMKVLIPEKITDEVAKVASAAGSGAQVEFAESTRAQPGIYTSTSLYTSASFIQNLGEAFSRFRIPPAMTPPREEPSRPSITLTWPTSARLR
jgi:general secretion pathway protein A